MPIEIVELNWMCGCKSSYVVNAKANKEIAIEDSRTHNCWQHGGDTTVTLPPITDKDQTVAQDK